MAIFKRIPKAQISRDFQYYGLFLGLVPVYVGDPEGQCRVAVRNWIPEWTLDFAEASMGTLARLGLMNSDFFMIKITGPIPGVERAAR